MAQMSPSSSKPNVNGSVAEEDHLLVEEGLMNSIEEDPGPSERPKRVTGVPAWTQDYVMKSD